MIPSIPHNLLRNVEGSKYHCAITCFIEEQLCVQLTQYRSSNPPTSLKSISLWAYLLGAASRNVHHFYAHLLYCIWQQYLSNKTSGTIPVKAVSTYGLRTLSILSNTTFSSTHTFSWEAWTHPWKRGKLMHYNLSLRIIFAEKLRWKHQWRCCHVLWISNGILQVDHILCASRKGWKSDLYLECNPNNHFGQQDEALQLNKSKPLFVSSRCFCKFIIPIP